MISNFLQSSTVLIALLAQLLLFLFYKFCRPHLITFVEVSKLQYVTFILIQHYTDSQQRIQMQNMFARFFLYCILLQIFCCFEKLNTERNLFINYLIFIILVLFWHGNTKRQENIPIHLAFRWRTGSCRSWCRYPRIHDKIVRAEYERVVLT